MKPRRLTPAEEVAAILLWVEEDLPQADIAERLHASASVVSRTLTRFREKFYTERRALLESAIEPRLLQEARQRLGRSGLSERLARLTPAHASAPPALRVYPSPPLQLPNADRVSAFARLAAPFVRHLISQAHRCGISWGGMADALVSSMSAPEQPNPNLLFFPLAGEALGQERTSSSSSVLADRLSQLFGGQAKSLTMVPALLPLEFDDEERQAIRKLMALLPDYVSIFGDPRRKKPRAEQPSPAEAETLDCIVTSSGTMPLGFSRGSLLSAEDQKLFLGDVAGVVFPHPGQSSKAQRRVDHIRESWTGLRESHLRACAERVREGRPGTILISMGAERAPVVKEAVARGLVSHLVICTELEQALGRLLPPA